MKYRDSAIEYYKYVISINISMMESISIDLAEEDLKEIVSYVEKIAIITNDIVYKINPERIHTHSSLDIIKNLRDFKIKEILK